jgi:4-carboxymuconolactone decarboxylase
VEETEQLRKARALRRQVLGDAYVDSQTAETDPAAIDFQAALGRMEEFRLHAAAMPQTGVTDDELDELLFQIAGYCGGPAALAARREIRAMRAERDGIV